YFFKDAGSFAVALVSTNKWGCQDTVVKSLKIEEDFTIYVPNVFSPNGDELNDIFLPIGRGISHYKLSVFNRWGEKIFETTDIHTGWNGTVNGETCQVGSYVWN